MTCPRCRVPMVEQKRSFHKQRKWRCPTCGKARMQRPQPDKQAKPGKSARDE